jgi:hypothetical protein
VGLDLRGRHARLTRAVQEFIGRRFESATTSMAAALHRTVESFGHC